MINFAPCLDSSGPLRKKIITYLLKLDHQMYLAMIWTFASQFEVNNAFILSIRLERKWSQKDCTVFRFKLHEAQENMNAMSKLSDHIHHVLLYDSRFDNHPARNILQRISRRQLYPLVHRFNINEILVSYSL